MKIIYTSEKGAQFDKGAGIENMKYCVTLNKLDNQKYYAITVTMLAWSRGRWRVSKKSQQTNKTVYTF